MCFFTNEKSFKNLDTWINLINADIEEGIAEIILVGNKSDLPDAKINVVWLNNMLVSMV